MRLEELINEALYLDGFEGRMDKIPFAELAKTFSVIGEYDSAKTYTMNDIILHFKKPGLPTKRNEIHIQNKYYGKVDQYNIFREEFINTVKTYKDHAKAGNNFIAKKKFGSKQEGQLRNEVPENPREYIFQPLVDIEKEYRVVVYYMNKKYRISGIYEKVGSNISFFKLDKNSKEGKGVSIMAIKAIRALGYGFGGVDVARVKTDPENLNIKNTAFPDLVVFEVNTLPSIRNPRILYDFVTDVNKNKSRGLLV